MRSGSILLAEDDDSIARLVSFKLSKEGLNVTLARNGKEAMELLSASSWDLIILDVMMPFHDGWQVLRAARGLPALTETPILMLTAKHLEDDVVSASELGATRFLRKPFDPAELSRTVLEILRPASRDSAGDELDQLRREFVATLSERRERLVRSIGSDSRREIRIIAHSLAGSAGSYGFSALGKIAGALDDLLALELERNHVSPAGWVSRLAEALERALDESYSRAEDCHGMIADAELEKIISGVESLGDGASS